MCPLFICILANNGKLQSQLVIPFMIVVCVMMFMVPVAFVERPTLSTVIVVGIVPNLDLTLRVFLASSRNSFQYPDSHQHKRAHHNPVCRYVHQVCAVDQSGNYNDITGEINSK